MERERVEVKTSNEEVEEKTSLLYHLPHSPLQTPEYVRARLSP
jgi:hypothetical protein